MNDDRNLNEGTMRELLTEFFEERAQVDADTHGQHHRWIAEQIEAAIARKDMFVSVAKAAIQWSVLGFLGAVWYWVQHGKWPV